jgi:cyanuric acid amidohydrolase
MLVPEVCVHVCPMDTPSDVSVLDHLIRSGQLDPRTVVAVIGKTEGTGLGKDIARETVEHSVHARLGAELGCDATVVGEQICTILSGGSPGVITPHVAILTQRLVDRPATHRSAAAGRLVVGRAASRDILPEEIGRSSHIDKVAEAVRVALLDAGVEDMRDVHAVLVKGPALTEAGIAEARGRGHEPVSSDLSIGPEGAMCFSNDASALGVGVATGEVDRRDLDDDAIRNNFSYFSDVAITSSAGERSHADVVVLANRADAGGELRIGHSSMTDILDLEAVARAVRTAGLPAEAILDDEVRDRVVYVLAKMIIPAAARLGDGRITLHDDPVGYHVAKAMGGYLVASMTGRTASFVSGGERNSHQGPPDGNPLAVIVRVDPPEG